MTLVESVKTVYKRYDTFSGRASRSEYWWFYAFTAIVPFLLLRLPAWIMVQTIHADRLSAWDPHPNPNMFLLYWTFLDLYWAFMLFSLVPFIAVTIRRLHDSGKHGYWWLAYLITFIGLIGVGLTGGSVIWWIVTTAGLVGSLLVFIFTLLPTDGPNRYGEKSFTIPPPRKSIKKPQPLTHAK